MSSSPIHDPGSKLGLANLISEITARINAGEHVDVSDYERMYPQYADQLRQLISALGAHSQLGIDPDPTPLNDVDFGRDSAAGSKHQLGDFRIVREIGRGGMGVVYEARQLSLGRRVALKVLPFAAMLDSRQLARFQNEAQAAACLHHPGIVPVHSVGCDRGVHYYAMQYIDGQSLAAVIGSLRGLWWDASASSSNETISCGHALASADTSILSAEPPAQLSAGASLLTSAAGPRIEYCRAIASLGIQAAEALEHAHQSGVIHRDIKPGNLLLDGQDKLWVTDFGLARIEQDSQLTMTGDVIGTLRYMSPEQAVNPSTGVDLRCDVYSLGATLYELLTLRPAYEGDDRQELLTKIAVHDPVSPRKLNRHIPAELETIVMKAMEKEPNARYQTANALAGDLRCFLEHRAISAKRPSIVARAHKWSRRHPSLVRSGIALLILMTLGSAIGSGLVLREQAETRRALSRAEYNFELSESNRSWAEKAVARSEKLLYVRGLGLAARAWQDGDGAAAASLMRSSPAAADRPELRGFEWHYLHWILAAQHDVIEQGATEQFSTACSSDGRYLATGNGVGEIRVWDYADMRVAAILQGHQGPVHSLAFHCGGEKLASVSDDGTLRVWNVVRAQELAVIDSCHGGGPVFAVAFSHDGERLASGGADHRARIWEASSLQQQHELEGHTREIRDVAFAPDDQSLVTASNDRELRLWDVGKGEHLRTLAGHTGMVLCVTFSRTGEHVISGSNDRTVRFWDSETGEQAAVIRGHLDGVQAVVLLPDGERILTGDRGGSLRIWRIQGKRLIDRFDGEQFARIDTVALSPDGRSWAGLTADGELLLRDLALKRTTVVQAGIATHYSLGQRDRVAFSPDGSQLFCSDRVLHSHPGTEARWHPITKLDVPAGVPGAFSPDGEILATGWNATIKLWDPLDGSLAGKLDTPVQAVNGLRFSPDGEHLLAWFLTGPIVIWDWKKQSVVQEIEHPDANIVDLEYSPDGRQIATCSRNGKVRLWNRKTMAWDDLEVGGKRFRSVSWLENGTALALSSPGVVDAIVHLESPQAIETVGVNQHVEDLSVCEKHSLILSHDQELGVVVRDLDRLEITSDSEDVLQGHTDRVWSLSVSHDGSRCISASRDGSVRVWPIPRPRWGWLAGRRHIDDRVNDFAWSNSGATLVMAEMSSTKQHAWPGGTLRVENEWFGNSGSDPMGFVCESVACFGEGKVVATGHRDGRVLIWGSSQAGPERVLTQCVNDAHVWALKFSPDGKRLVAAIRDDNRLKIWNTDTWEELCDITAADCDDIAFSSCGRWLAYCDGREAVLLEMDTLKPGRRFRGHSITVHGLAFAADDSALATACEDRKLRVWDPRTGELLQTLSGHTASIQRVTFSREGSTLVSGDADGVIKLWHLESGQELFTLAQLGSGIRKLQFDNSGGVLLACTEDGRIHAFEGQAAP